MTSTRRLSGEEGLHSGGVAYADALGRVTVRDWWSWSFSNVLDDGVRGALAEYLVARLLGASDQPVKGWPYDFSLADGTRIEVRV
jgi:hypothetical protein